MPQVVMYTTRICPYCVRAKRLLALKGVDYEERLIEGNRELIREMMARSNRRTVPQIFIDDYHVGGYDDLAELDAFGGSNLRGDGGRVGRRMGQGCCRREDYGGPRGVVANGASDVRAC